MATDATTRIKNLSIALEALSRINNEGSPDLYERISTLLEDEIHLHKKEIKDRKTARSAEPTTDDDDAIPF